MKIKMDAWNQIFDYRNPIKVDIEKFETDLIESIFISINPSVPSDVLIFDLNELIGALNAMKGGK